MAFSFQKILVAIDGSENADYALNIAIKIAEKYASRVDLLHVRTPVASPTMIPAPLIDPIMGSTTMIAPPQLHQELQKPEDLLAPRRQLIIERNIKGNADLIDSVDVAGEILKRANTEGHDLIVLGSRGLGGLKSLILGSVSLKVAKEAKCSVLIMKTKIDSIPRILLGYDGSAESKKALECADDLAKKFHTPITVLSVVNIPISSDGFAVSSIEKWEAEMNQVVDEAVSKLKAGGTTANGKVLDYSDISRAIAEEAERGSYNMIIVGSRGLGRLKSLFLGSVASGVANASKTNTLIIR